MATYTQFFHISGYGVAPRARAPGWSCVDGITREGARAPGAIRHLAYPAEPRLLHGIPPIEAGRLAADRAMRARDAAGRRLRRDGVVLLAAVASYPLPRALVEQRGEEHEADLYRHWRDTALEWLKATFGAALMSVVEHHDEEYLHLHAFVVPAIGPDERLQLGVVHPGRRALDEVAAAGGGKEAQRKAYCQAMRTLQDTYHRAVGSSFGHDRLGPRRQRIARTEHLRSCEAATQDAAREAAFLERTISLRTELEETVGRQYVVPLADAQREVVRLTEERQLDQAIISRLVKEIKLLRNQLGVQADQVIPRR